MRGFGSEANDSFVCCISVAAAYESNGLPLGARSSIGFPSLSPAQSTNRLCTVLISLAPLASSTQTASTWTQSGTGIRRDTSTETRRIGTAVCSTGMLLAHSQNLLPRRLPELVIHSGSCMLPVCLLAQGSNTVQLSDGDDGLVADTRPLARLDGCTSVERGLTGQLALR